MHRAAQIIDAIATLVRTRVEPSGVHVYTHRRESLSAEQDELPAISIDYGELAVDLQDPEEDYYDCTLGIVLTIIDATADSPLLRESLMNLAVESQAAINADPLLALDFVNQTMFNGWAAPDIESKGSRFVGAIATNWQVKFRMLFDNAGASGPIPNL